jgi:hypothetical protein
MKQILEIEIEGGEFPNELRRISNRTRSFVTERESEMYRVT